MTFRKLGLGAVVAALIAWMPAAAMAQDCKPELKVDSEPSVSRSLGAFPGSLFKWKAEAKRVHGDAYDTWLKAADRRIDCKQTAGKWVCTRSAKPCATAASATPSVCSKLPKFKDLARLERGNSGDEVKLLQEYLNCQGAKLTADGKFGPGTYEAVVDYQKKEGLDPADGIAGRATKKRLMEET